MTDKQLYFIEKTKLLKGLVADLAKELRDDNPYNYTRNSIVEWMAKCLDTLENHLIKAQPKHRSCELDFDHYDKDY